MATLKALATMQAVRIESYGGPEVLSRKDAPRPEPEAGEVLVRVHAAGVNPLDAKVRAGLLKGWLHHQLPITPGWDVSGVVEGIGSSVTAFGPGDQVYGMLDFTRDGAYAEYVVARTSNIAPKPRSLDHTKAAAIPLAALTAWQALFDAAGLTSGQTVLVHGAAGGVGHFAVQLARWKGAKVIGTCAAPNVDFVRQLGAHEAVDYLSVRFEDVVHDADLVLDTIGGETQERSWDVLRKGGILVSTVGVQDREKPAQRNLRAAELGVRPDAGQLARIAALADAGDLKPYLQAVLPLEQASKAHEMIQSGHVRGKIVLTVA